MSTKCLRLTTGEELIAELTENDTSYTLKTPANIFMVPNGKGGIGLNLLPLFPYADSREFTFPKTAVVIVFTPSREMLNEYNRLFGSGIVIPTLDSRELLTELKS